MIEVSAMYDKVKVMKCKTCGEQFKSEVLFKKGKMHAYIDCPKCRKDKTRYLGSLEVYKAIYTEDSEG